jgi:hypothetical protein
VPRLQLVRQAARSFRDDLQATYNCILRAYVASETGLVKPINQLLARTLRQPAARAHLADCLGRPPRLADDGHAEMRSVVDFRRIAEPAASNCCRWCALDNDRRGGHLRSTLQQANWVDRGGGPPGIAKLTPDIIPMTHCVSYVM